jgi:2-keto-4-pentenoate hydratase/2-oxohepta-3-ene-1,7-dioic acid hydratase in catechol pathway
MRIIRYRQKEGPIQFGWILDEPSGELAGPIEGSIFGGFRRLEAELPLDKIRLLPPVLPGKIVCIGRNYAAHAKEHNVDVPAVPLIFLKPPSTLIGPGDAIRLPPQSAQVEHEAELVIVIGKSARWITPESALDYVLGYTAGNDVTAKGFDTFCPIGPWIETKFDPSDSVISCYVNDEMRQMSSTRDMIFTVRQLIAFITSIMTLEPGDLIMTGTPSGVGPLQDGDTVEVTIEGLGSLRNPVIAETIP